MSDLEKFISDLVGIPWQDRGRTPSGFDCWGLIYHIYKNFYDIELEYYDEYSFKETAKARAIVEDAATKWSEIEQGKEKPGDVVLFYPCHVGLVIGKNYMINSLEHFGTVVQRYTMNPWKTLVEGFYRHESNSLS